MYRQLYKQLSRRKDVLTLVHLTLREQSEAQDEYAIGSCPPFGKITCARINLGVPSGYEKVSPALDVALE